MFVAIWEYEVRSGKEAEFRRHYAPDGSWAGLFRRQAGYLGTDLLEDCERPGRFVTLDRWEDEASFRSFRQRFAAEYEALDRACEALAQRESRVGAFGSGPWRP